jgi:hypothetical protein
VSTPTKIEVRKRTPADLAAARANPHAAGLGTAKRGGLMQPNTRSDSRLILPSKPNVSRVARGNAGDVIDQRVKTLRGELAKMIETSVQKLLPGAADARELQNTLDVLTESIRLNGEETKRALAGIRLDLDLMAEAVTGNADAATAIRESLAQRRVNARNEVPPPPAAPKGAKK